MRFETLRTPDSEIEVGPARIIAVVLAIVAGGCLIALFSSGLNFFSATFFALVVILVAGRGVYHLLLPQLVLRFTEHGLQYKWRDRRWTSSVHRPFVSPWFIGFRGDGLRAFGVFPSQLTEDGFRQLAKTLRQGRSGEMG